MNRTLRIRDFKCFSDTAIPLTRMTVLCGHNSGGKSSILQAMLLHSFAGASAEEEIPVNGPYGLQLGDAEWLMNRNSGKDIDEGFNIGLSPGYEVAFSAGSTPRTLAFKASEVEPSALNRVVYLSAERSGPRVVQDSFSNKAPAATTIGHAGQFVAEVIAELERTLVRDLIRPEEFKETALLLPVIEHYMSDLFGPIEIQVRTNGNAPPSIYFKRPGVQEDWVLSSNTGFGITYALPVIVAGVLATEDLTLIVDSPEAHLHPAAQTALARFLCLVAASGVNVIIETHSDYVIEGVRIDATSQAIQSISRNDCSIVSVSADEAGSRALTVLSIAEDGRPSDWPDGFFDQHILNMREILNNTKA